MKRTSLLVAAVTLACLAAGGVAIRAYDFGWHVAAGDWIRAHGRPPSSDPLAFTAEGVAWVDHGWLFQIILSAAVAAAGPAGAWLMKQALVLAAFLLPAIWMARRRISPLLAGGLMVIALEGARFRFFARPEIAGLAAASLLVILLVQAAAARRPWLWLAPVPLLIVVWVNVHPSALLGAGLTAVFGWAQAAQVGLLARRARPFVVTPLLGGLALLANPYGARILGVPLAIGNTLQGGGIRNPEWGSALRPEFSLFWMAALGFVVIALVTRKDAGRAHLPAAVSGALLALAGALSLRFIGFFFVCLPVLLLALPARVPRLARLDRIALLPPLAAALLFVAAPHGGPLGTGLAPGRFPEAMAASFVDLEVSGRLYNPVRFGGYLAWRLRRPIFVDGRNEVHGPLLERMAACRTATDLACWDRLLDDWGIEAALVEYDPQPVRVRLADGRFEQRSSAAVYFRRSRWALIDWDDTAMLMVRREGKNGELARRLEDRELTPDEPERFAARLRQGSVDRERAVHEIRRQRRRRPGSLRAETLERLLLGPAENRAGL